MAGDGAQCSHQLRWRAPRTDGLRLRDLLSPEFLPPPQGKGWEFSGYGQESRDGVSGSIIRHPANHDGKPSAEGKLSCPVPVASRVSKFKSTTGGLGSAGTHSPTRRLASRDQNQTVVNPCKKQESNWREEGSVAPERTCGPFAWAPVPTRQYSQQEHQSVRPLGSVCANTEVGLYAVPIAPVLRVPCDGDPSYFIAHLEEVATGRQRDGHQSFSAVEKRPATGRRDGSQFRGFYVGFQRDGSANRVDAIATWGTPTRNFPFGNPH
ncbi:hypothetical protein B0H16DRAFT_1466710 [Mycena metata]|uniref:Uncharacterized protein n=1 Tax=Mycena metata TaxID=1033252 RepID=A0AAD7I748_9AGAR|nr:hypothetical protein B0H16DRAFT_1466710 [Mycena metata]